MNDLQKIMAQNEAIIQQLELFRGILEAILKALPEPAGASDT